MSTPDQIPNFEQDQVVGLNNGRGSIVSLAVDILPPDEIQSRIGNTVRHVFSFMPGDDGLLVMIEPPAVQNTPEARQEASRKQRVAMNRRRADEKGKQSIDREEANHQIGPNAFEPDLVDEVVIGPKSTWEFSFDKAIKLGDFTLGRMRSMASVGRVGHDVPPDEAEHADEFDLTDLADKKSLRLKMTDSDYLRVKKIDDDSEHVEIEYVHRGVVYVRAVHSAEFVKGHKTVSSLAAAAGIATIAAAGYVLKKHTSSQD